MRTLCGIISVACAAMFIDLAAANDDFAVDYVHVYDIVEEKQ